VGPEGVAVDAYGNIFVANSRATANTITVYSATGNLQYTQH
jgi:DNA-binding beta-propeller fold protein YncE